MAVPQNLYVMNYFPVNNAGYQMWSSYNGVQYQADMQAAKSLGFNVLRTVLAARTGVFDYPAPTAAELAKLADFYNRSKSAGIKLHLTLFDWWTNAYGQVSASESWVSAVLNALPDLTNIAFIELQNEVIFASVGTYSGGFDSGWPSGTPQYTQIGQVALVWAQQLTAYIRSAAPGVPVTVSCTNGTADLSAYVTATRGISSQPDFYDWHCYEGISPQLIYPALQAVIATVGDPAMLFIGETGATSTPGGAQGSMQAQQLQADYIQTARWACAQLGLREPAPWILSDMKPSVQFASGNTYGLYDVNGNLKLAGQMYQAHPPGSIVPGVDLNGAMTNGQPDSGGNVLPARWSLYKGNTGTQPINAVLDSANMYRGYPSVLLTGSGSSSGTDNPPALMTVPFCWPVVSGNQSYTFSIALKAAGSYGSPNLEISWYTSTGGYISSANGSVLSLTGSFVLYSLQGTSPSGAATALVEINTKQNAGSIWAAGATWTGPPARLAGRGGQWFRR